ncbi:MAG: PqqD family protein [Terriglobales bacterium]
MQRYARNPKIEAAPMKGECVLFNPQNNKFCLLNGTAALLWAKLDSAKSADELALELEQNFSGVDPATARQDTAAAMKDLLEVGCVTAMD